MKNYITTLDQDHEDYKFMLGTLPTDEDDAEDLDLLVEHQPCDREKWWHDTFFGEKLNLSENNIAEGVQSFKELLSIQNEHNDSTSESESEDEDADTDFEDVVKISEDETHVSVNKNKLTSLLQEVEDIIDMEYKEDKVSLAEPHLSNEDFEKYQSSLFKNNTTTK